MLRISPNLKEIRYTTAHKAWLLLGNSVKLIITCPRGKRSLSSLCNIVGITSLVHPRSQTVSGAVAKILMVRCVSEFVLGAASAAPLAIFCMRHLSSYSPTLVVKRNILFMKRIYGRLVKSCRGISSIFILIFHSERMKIPTDTPKT